MNRYCSPESAEGVRAKNVGVFVAGLQTKTDDLEVSYEMSQMWDTAILRSRRREFEGLLSLFSVFPIAAKHCGARK
jgi:hypothetical protein